jgi:hypothetical protein
MLMDAPSWLVSSLKVSECHRKLEKADQVIAETMETEEVLMV